MPASSARVHVSGRARWRVAVISAAPLLPIPTGIAGEDSQRKTTLSSDHAAKLIQKHPAIPCPAHSTVPSNDQGCVPDHTKASLSQTVPRNPCFGASASLKQGTGNTEKQPAWLQHLQTCQKVCGRGQQQTAAPSCRLRTCAATTGLTTCLPEPTRPPNVSGSPRRRLGSAAKDAALSRHEPKGKNRPGRIFSAKPNTERWGGGRRDALCFCSAPLPAPCHAHSARGQRRCAYPQSPGQ